MTQIEQAATPARAATGGDGGDRERIETVAREICANITGVPMTAEQWAAGAAENPDEAEGFRKAARAAIKVADATRPTQAPPADLGPASSSSSGSAVGQGEAGAAKVRSTDEAVADTARRAAEQVAWLRLARAADPGPAAGQGE